MNKSKFHRFVIFFLASVFIACNNQQNPKIQVIEKPYNPSDYSFKTIKIGSNIWMAENLDVVIYHNGDSIPLARTKEEWLMYDENRIGAWCAYDFDLKNVEIYGRIYNRHVLFEVSRNIAPEGWHIAYDNEWDELVNVLGGHKYAGAKLKSKGNLKDSTGLWVYDQDENAQDSIGFCALPGGCIFDDGTFVGSIGYFCSFWTGIGEIRSLEFSSSYVDASPAHDIAGVYVRCVKNKY